MHGSSSLQRRPILYADPPVLHVRLCRLAQSARVFSPRKTHIMRSGVGRELRDLFGDVLTRHFGVTPAELAGVLPSHTSRPVGLFV
jgi:hypothetical protein